MKFKRGDSFDFTGPVTIKVNGVVLGNATGYSANSQIRDEDGNLIANLAAVFTSYIPPVINLAFAGNSQGWPPGQALIDIEFLTPDGKVASTDTVKFTIDTDVTRAV